MSIFHKGLCYSSIFSLCNSKDEDMLHALRDCCKGRGVWLVVGVLDLDFYFLSIQLEILVLCECEK